MLQEYKEVPKGWKLDSGITTTPKGYLAITNGKSRFNSERKCGIIKRELALELLEKA